MNKKKFRISDRIVSIKFALEGILSFFKSEHNARIHIVAAAAAISAGFYFKLSTIEWCLICVAIALVFISEMFNTAVEILCNTISPEINPSIKKIKDIAAGAVLTAALAAVSIGLLIFLPKFI